MHHHLSWLMETDFFFLFLFLFLQLGGGGPRGWTKKDVTSSKQLKPTNNITFSLGLFLSCHRNSIRAQQSPACAHTHTHTQRCRLRYSEACWGKSVRFLCDAFSPWGQGATVIQPYGAAVQKPPPMNTHWVDSSRCFHTLGGACCRFAPPSIAKECGVMLLL